MGAMIQVHRLNETGYRGERFADWSCQPKGNNSLFILSQAAIVRHS
jgi:5-methyltetrahydrofolate--homocysteine methyltransferase